MGSDFLVNAIGEFIDVAVTIQVDDLLASLKALDEYFIEEVGLASVGSTDDLHDIVGVYSPLDLFNIAAFKWWIDLFNPPLEDGIKFDTDLRFKVIRFCDDFLYGVEVLADDNFMIIGGLGDAVDVELISAEEILN